MGIVALYPGPHTSRRDVQQRLYPYLLRGLQLTHPNQVWGVDSTSSRLLAGGLDLVAILDWYARLVVSWELSDTLEIEFVLQAVERALSQGRPEIWNSHQGSHFTSPQYSALGSRGSQNQHGRQRACLG